LRKSSKTIFVLTDIILMQPFNKGKNPQVVIKEAIIQHADTNSYCGSIIFTKLPQIYFL